MGPTIALPGPISIPTNLTNLFAPSSTFNWVHQTRNHWFDQSMPRTRHHEQSGDESLSNKSSSPLLTALVVNKPRPSDSWRTCAPQLV